MAQKLKQKVKPPRASTDLELSAAFARGRVEMKRDGARSAVYNPKRDEVQIVLNSGVSMSIPRKQIPGLENAAVELLREVELSPMTTSISFPKLNADYSVHGLIRTVLGLNNQQRIAGSVTSPAKRAAAARNGLRGGRPTTATAKKAPKNKKNAA
jgi:hypothetical protein